MLVLQVQCKVIPRRSTRVCKSTAHHLHLVQNLALRPCL
uniref:Uncharacterized protein n=1 Tax=Anguilla anguilla TaxID=7936 RepID=A0A0E9UA44_ANGAN